MFQTKVVEKMKTHVCSVLFFFFRSNVQKYFTAGQAADDNITLHMRIACWISKATNTHLEYVIIFAFSQQQSLHKRASMLRYSSLPPIFRYFFTI
jgi:hypothetical protein